MIWLPLSGGEPVEELVEVYPQVQGWLGERDVLCVQCGQVYWGPLNELCAARGLDDNQTAALLAELNAFLQDIPPA